MIVNKHLFEFVSLTGALFSGRLLARSLASRLLGMPIWSIANEALAAAAAEWGEDPHPVTGSHQRVPQIINTLPHSRTQTRGMLRFTFSHCTSAANFVKTNCAIHRDHTRCIDQTLYKITRGSYLCIKNDAQCIILKKLYLILTNLMNKKSKLIKKFNFLVTSNFSLKIKLDVVEKIP